MSCFLAGSSFVASSSLASLSSSSSSSLTTTSAMSRSPTVVAPWDAGWVDVEPVDDPLPLPGGRPASEHDGVVWAGRQVLEWPEEEAMICRDSKADRISPAPVGTLRFDHEDAIVLQPLAERQPRIGQVKRKREELLSPTEADSSDLVESGEAAVRRSLALVQPGADNLRALAHMLGSEVAGELTLAQAQGVGRELGEQLRKGGKAAPMQADCAAVLAGLVQAALASPRGVAALAALVRSLGETLRGSPPQLPAGFLDTLFAEAAQLSLVPLAEAGLAPDRLNAASRLGPLKLVLATLRDPHLSPASLAWFRDRVVAQVMPPQADRAQDDLPADPATPVRVLGALARAFVDEGDIPVGHALSVAFLNGLGALEDLKPAKACKWLVEGLGGTPNRTLGMMMAITPLLQPAAARQLQAWMSTGKLWTGYASPKAKAQDTLS